jgi:hypothetical protein
MAKLLEGKPERKAFLDGDPEFKAAVFETSRQMAEAKPILDMVPTVDDARFMQENTAAMVGMRRSAMLAVEDTSSLPQFFEQFDSQFAVVDKDGNPVLDAAGKPSYAADREIIVGGLVGREMERVSAELTPQIEQLKRQLATGVYPNEAAKAMAQKQLEDMEWGAQLIGLLPAVLDGSFLKQVAPEIPGDASAEFKTWAEGERKRIDEDNAKLDEKKRDTGKETRKTERAQFESSIRGESARGAGDIIGTALKAEMDGGVYIPEFYLQEKWRDPATGQDSNTSALAMKVFTQFEKQLRQPGSRTLMTITEHELLPRTPQTKEMRSTWYRQQAAKIIPGLVKAEVERIQQLVQVDQDKLAGQHRQRQQVAQPEPNSGSSSLPQGLTENQLTTRAEELASKRPDWAGANRGERQALILTERKRIQRSGAK